MRLSTYLVGVPAVAVAAVIAVANRQTVAFSLDPFSPDFAARMPLFLLLFAAFALGALVGGAVAIWPRRGRRKPQEDTSARRGGKNRLPALLRGSKPPEA